MNVYNVNTTFLKGMDCLKFDIIGGDEKKFSRNRG